MEDFRVKTSWRTSRKRKMLRASHGVEAVLAIEDLWSYCAAERVDGVLSGLTDEDIAAECDWPIGDAESLVSRLVELRLLDGVSGDYRIHDWHEHNPYVSGGRARSEKAQHAAHARWHKEQADKDCPLCKPNALALPDDASGMLLASSGNAPSLPPTIPPSTFSSLRKNDIEKFAKAAEINRLDDLEAFASRQGWCAGLSSRHRDWGARVGPITVEEIKHALGVVEAKGGKGNRLGLFLSIVERDRADAAAPPVPDGKARASPTERKSWQQIADEYTRKGIDEWLSEGQEK